MRQTSLIVFGRYPRLGEGKRRLAADIGDQAAFEFIDGCTNHTIAVVNSTGFQPYFYVASEEDVSLMRNRLDATWEVRAQVGATLGERLMSAFSEVYAAGAENVLVIGTDAPGLEGAHVMHAAQALLEHDAVVSPAGDGGYSLLGLSYWPSSVFDGVDWSTDVVLAQTLARIKQDRRRAHLLPEVLDIDTAHDLERWLTISEPSELPAWSKSALEALVAD